MVVAAGPVGVARWTHDPTLEPETVPSAPLQAIAWAKGKMRDPVLALDRGSLVEEEDAMDQSRGRSLGPPIDEQRGGTQGGSARDKGWLDES